jgi:hypothetical protein
MKKLIVIISLILVTTPDIFPQVNVKGSVLSNETGNPIPYANIYLEGETIGTCSNIEGRFSFKIPDQYKEKQISVSAIGYKSFHANLEDFQVKDTFYLTMEVIPIDEVVVTAEPIGAEPIISRVLDSMKENYVNPVKYITYSRQELELLKKKKTVYIAEEVSEVLVKNDKSKVGIIKSRFNKFPGINNEHESSNYISANTIFSNQFPVDGASLKIKDESKISVSNKLYLLLKNKNLQIRDSLVENYVTYNKYKLFDLYDYELAGRKYYNRDTLYEIKYSPNPSFKENKKLPSGIIYVNMEDFGVVYKKTVNSKEELEDRRLSKINQWMAGNINFTHHSNVKEQYWRKVNGKYYIRFLNTTRNYTYHDYKKNTHTKYQEVEFTYVTSASDSNVNFSSAVQKQLSNNFVLEFDRLEMNFNEDFWGNYNYIKVPEKIKKQKYE